MSTAMSGLFPVTPRKAYRAAIGAPPERRSAPKSPLWTPQISHVVPEPLGGAGRPISARWRQWQSDGRNQQNNGKSVGYGQQQHGQQQHGHQASRYEPALATRGRRGTRTAYGTGRPAQPPIHGSVHACFERYDRNGSGHLDYRELRIALQHLGLDLSQAEAAEVLAEYDADGNGLMELEEFARLVRICSPSPHSPDYSRGHGSDHSAGYYYLPPAPHLPPRTLAAAELMGELMGELQVWVSASAGRWIASQHSDQPAGGAYVVLELAGHKAQSVLLPPSGPVGATPSGEGNLFRLPVGARLAAAELRLDTVAWWPGMGERSLGSTDVPLQEVIELGRLELRTPLDAVVELVWQWQAPDDSGGGRAQRYGGDYRDAERLGMSGGSGWA